MTVGLPVLLSASNVSHAWGLAFLRAMRTTKQSIDPIVLSIDSTGGLPPEDRLIRDALDSRLVALGCNKVGVSALTIFPYEMWARRGRPDVATFSRLCVDKLLPRMRRRDDRNQYGTYFGRMMSFSGEKTGRPKSVNQLEFIVSLLNQPRRPRHSALQVACFDPAKDHTGQAVRGFPCLQQISLGYDDQRNLALTALYPTQYVFDRAYGNYLGLCQLGEFIAHQTSMRFRRLTCIVGRPELGDVNKSDLRALEALVRGRLQLENIQEC